MIISGASLDILMLTPWFPNRPDGWPSRFVADSARALARQGHRVRVGVLRGMTPAGTARFASPEHRGEIEVAQLPEIEEIRLARYPTLPGGLMRKLTNRTLDRALTALAGEMIAARRPDVILVQTETLAPAAHALAARMGLPVVGVLHGENSNWRYLWTDGQAERFRDALSGLDRLVVVGEPLRRFATDLSGRADHIEVVWNGVDPAPDRPPLQLPDEAPLRLVSVANLHPAKGVNLLIAALGRLAREEEVPWHLTIIGDGPERATLAAQIARQGLADRITLTGQKPHEDVLATLGQSDIFALPSWREAFGIVYLEAMAAGALCIGVEGQGPAQFLRNGETGFLVAPRSVGALVETLRPLLTGPRAEWRAIARAGTRFARDHASWDAHARALSEVLHLACVRAAPYTQEARLVG